VRFDERLDPEIRSLRALTGGSSFLVATTRAEIAAMREQRAASGLGRADLSGRVERSDHVVSSDPPVRVRMHRPAGADGPLPCVVSMHPGGYIVGSYADDDTRHDRWCSRLGYLGVAVDYRLVPETPYPGRSRTATRR
jgi:acetyl esterase/lipase